jgi:hypothetical protein
MGSTRPPDRGTRRTTALTAVAVGGSALAAAAAPGHGAVLACAAGFALAVGAIAVLTGVAAALALCAAFALTPQRRRAARRTLVVLLRLAPWYSSRS